MELRTPSCRERSHDVSSDDNNQREDLIEKMEGGFSDTDRGRGMERERERGSTIVIRRVEKTACLSNHCAD